MISEILTGNNIATASSPILNSLMRNNPGVDLEEEKFEEEFTQFQTKFEEIPKINENDKIGRDNDGKYYGNGDQTFKCYNIKKTEVQLESYEYLKGI